MEKIYQINTSLYKLDIKEIEISKKTKSFYWVANSNYRCALDTNYYKSFESIEKAKSHLEYLIKKQIEENQTRLNKANDTLLKFESLYKTK